jgi:hypothetical protein
VQNSQCPGEKVLSSNPALGCPCFASRPGNTFSLKARKQIPARGPCKEIVKLTSHVLWALIFVGPDLGRNPCLIGVQTGSSRILNEIFSAGIVSDNFLMLLGRSKQRRKNQ